MSDASIKEAVKRAAEIAETAPADLKTKAFEVVLTSLLIGHPASMPAELESPSATTGVSTSAMTINELLAKSGASTHVARVTVIAFHALRNGASGVTRRDISEAYSKARTKKPQNIPDVIGQCVQRGYLIEGDKKDGAKAWVITPSGEQAVAAMLKGK